MARPDREQVYSVSQLNRLARQILEQDLPALWLEGEISNLARPASGHLYFSLKDEHAQIRCAMFRGNQRGVGFVPSNGLQVLVRGRVSLYEPRGEFQFIAEHMEAAGEGLLRRRLEELKQKLAAEGLFAGERKRPLPGMPRCIGIITSPTGAAIRDILHILRRRFPSIPVVLYPVQVQGEAAKHDIVRALGTAAARNDCDVLIVARGGGSLEDLWAFNEEIVARAIAASPMPVISGVGHEIDFTIADFVADVRAPTPSGAAELVVPDMRDWLRQIRTLEQRASRCALRAVQDTVRHHRHLEVRLGQCHPRVILRQHAQRLDELRQKLAATLSNRLSFDRLRLAHALTRLRSVSPAIQIRMTGERVTHARARLQSAMSQQIRDPSHRLAVLSGRLNTVSPLSTLQRGYAIVLGPGGAVVRAAAALQPGDRITAKLAEGALEATVLRPLP